MKEDKKLDKRLKYVGRLFQINGMLGKQDSKKIPQKCVVQNILNRGTVAASTTQWRIMIPQIAALVLDR